MMLLIMMCVITAFAYVGGIMAVAVDQMDGLVVSYIPWTVITPIIIWYVFYTYLDYHNKIKETQVYTALSTFFTLGVSMFVLISMNRSGALYPCIVTQFTMATIIFGYVWHKRKITHLFSFGA